jgi:AcrR family transcriptional regulator
MVPSGEETASGPTPDAAPDPGSDPGLETAPDPAPGAEPNPAARTRGRPRNAAADTAILDATRALLAERGFADLTIAEVAARAGVAKTTLYRRWPGKSDLVVDAMAALFGSLELVDHGSMLADALGVVRQYAALLSLPETKAALLALAAESQCDASLHEKVKRQVVHPQRRLVLEGWERAAARGEVEGETDVDLIFDIVCGTLVQRILIGGEPVDDDYLARLVGVLLGGLAQLREDGGL